MRRLLFVLLVIIIAFASPALGARLISESFEEASGWTSDVGTGCAVDESYTGVTPSTGGGDEVLRTVSAESGYKAIYYKALAAEAPVTYFRAYLWVDSITIGTNFANKAIVYAEDDSLDDAWILNLQRTATGYRFNFQGFNNGAIAATQTADIALQTWHLIEVKYDVTGTAFEFKLNGTSVVSAELSGTYRTGIRRFSLGPYLASQLFTCDLSWDLVDVETTGYVGSGLFYRVRLDPNADTAYEEWTTSEEADYYSLLSDGDDLTYVHTSADAQGAAVHVADPSSAGDIMMVRVWFRAQYVDADNRRIAVGLVTEANSYEKGDYFTLTGTWKNYYQDFITNPDDDQAWEWTDIDGVRLYWASGASSIADSGGQVSEAWVEVISAPSSGKNFYLNCAPIFGGVDSDTIKVWIRGTGAGSAAIRYGTVEANVLGNSGDTVTTSGVTLAAANDYCHTFTIDSLSAATQYFFDVIIDGQSVATFEATEDDNSYWDALPTCTTFPETSNTGSFSFMVGGDFHSEAPLAPLMAQMGAQSAKFFIDLGDHTGSNTDTKATLWSDHRERRGYGVPAVHLTDNVLRKVPMFHTWSDHDYLEDDSHKFGIGDHGDAYTYMLSYAAMDAKVDYTPLPTITQDATGTATGGSAGTLIDTTTDFTGQSIYPGMVVHNTTDGSYSFVDSVAATTITLSQNLSGGTANVFAATDSYRIQRGGLWHSFRYGLAEFFVLDTRYKRDPNGMADGDLLDGRNFLGADYAGGNADPGDGTAAGHVQRDWLVNAVNNSTATWKFICSEIPFKADQEGNDAWGAYDANDAQRDYLIANITAKNVIWLNADRHMNALDDGKGANDPWPSVNASPLFGYQQAASFIETVAEWKIQGLAASVEGASVVGAFGLITVGEKTVSIKLLDADGNEVNTGTLDLSMTVYFDGPNAAGIVGGSVLSGKVLGN